MDFNLGVKVDGHCFIKDDLGQTLLDKKNAVHPQNIARIISRALSNESNYFVHRVAFGNGGTEVDAAFQITFKTPNDGQPPDPNTWDSRLYNETYSEIVDDSNVSLGVDPGSSGPNTGSRTGGGSSPGSDPTSVEHVSGPGVRSNELGVQSQVVVTVVLNPNEPAGQQATDGSSTIQATEDDFVFDEIGLYTTGAPGLASAGYQNINVGNKVSTDDSGLLPNTAYTLTVTVNGGVAQIVNFTTPASGSGTTGEILYGDLCEALNTGDPTWGLSGSPAITGASVAITDTSGSFASISGAQTYGFITIQSNATGSTSSIDIDSGSTMLAALNPPAGASLEAAYAGQDAGIQNDPVNPLVERERLLTHLIFSPILKSANRTLTITYTLTISVARTST